MSEGDRPYLLHIRDAIERIEEYTRDGREAFASDRKTQDAVIRNLEVIGEAAKRLSAGLRSEPCPIPWRAVAGMRDKLIHHYFGVKLDLVWEVVERELPTLRAFLDRQLVGPGPGEGSTHDPDNEPDAGPSPRPGEGDRGP